MKSCKNEHDNIPVWHTTHHPIDFHATVVVTHCPRATFCARLVVTCKGGFQEALFALRNFSFVPALFFRALSLLFE